VKLSHGTIRGDRLVCAYHGWEFGESGQCLRVPYLTAEQQIPSGCHLRAYPVREQDGFVWLFPGDPELSDQRQPLALPEWSSTRHIVSWTRCDCASHFSYLIENLMDMYHGHLHRHYQAWSDPHLERIEPEPDRVTAYYRALCAFRIRNPFSVLELLIPALRRPYRTNLDVHYAYPHWRAELGPDFRLTGLFLPVDEQTTRLWLVHAVSLEKFPIHRMPRWMQRIQKRLFTNAARPLMNGLLRDDAVMVYEEQQAHAQNPKLQNIELNPALASVQRLIRHQAAVSAG
jgi:phenylpropionate dioxygenase-like ring-hydroxylating dioxygenase large terminal subunit